MLGLIIRREFTTLLGSKAMRISTAVVVALFLIAGVVGHFLLNRDSDQEPDQLAISVTSDTAALTPYLTALGANVTDIGSADPEQAAREEDTPVISGNPDSPTIFATSSDESLQKLIVLAATQRLVDDAGALTPEMSSKLAALSFTVVTDVSENSMSSNPIGYLVGNVSVLMLMMVTIMGVSVLSSGVVEEKSSRVVEILLTAVRPRTLLLGKILGIGSAVLVIFLIYLLGILGGLGISGLLSHLDVLSGINLARFLPILILWIVLGYFTYAAFTGGISATVSRQEDLGAVQTPIIFLQLVPVYTAIYLVPLQPEALITKVLSYTPFFSPFMMTMRSALGEVALWEQLLALCLTLLAIPLLGILAGKIYERSILHTGERMKLSQVFSRA